MNTKANAGKPFTHQDDATIRRMHGEGSSISEIAADMLRTEAGITARLERLGLRAPGPIMRKQAAILLAR